MSASPGRFTFAVIGHDEAATLAAVLEQAFAAAEPSDEVWFVDSASTDGSATIAASLGAEVVDAPLGKGRAIATALERCGEGSLCLVDADIQGSGENIPLLLRRAGAASDAEMVVGQVDAVGKRGSVTTGIYRPLVRALFREAFDPAMRKPLSGFRVLRAGANLEEMPPDYGVEAHLNIHVAITGGRIELCRLGAHRGPLRYANAAAIGAQIASVILDLAERHGRLHRAARPDWDAWLEPILGLIRDQPAEGEEDGEYLRRLDELAARPPPSPIGASRSSGARSSRRRASPRARR